MSINGIHTQKKSFVKRPPTKAPVEKKVIRRKEEYLNNSQLEPHKKNLHEEKSLPTKFPLVEYLRTGSKKKMKTES